VGAGRNGASAPPDPARRRRSSSQASGLCLVLSLAGLAARAVTPGPRDGGCVQRGVRRGQEAALQAAVREGELHVHLPPR
jgi:hypothetical protein